MGAAIRVEQVSKKYDLGVADRWQFLREWVSRARGARGVAPDADPNSFWALRDISFEVEEGEVVGVLGRNGAGKSTLLKILSRITSPSSGVVKVRGRVGSLLEVGTGFHPDLSGRDNVFLNGTVLGMTHREVASRFDEIVAFSGVEEFIDTPVKRYSSGMRVRLAFAVAAHLQPEILILDEVLAVGDAAFQQKCLGKIGAVSRSGRTVIFVSHNAAAIESFCTRGIVLERGQMLFDGTQSEALEFYMGMRTVTPGALEERTDRTGLGTVRVTAVQVRNSSGQAVTDVRAGSDISIALHFERRSPLNYPLFAARINIRTHLGAPAFTLGTYFSGIEFPELPQRGVLICEVQDLPLPIGTYHVDYRLISEAGTRGDVLDSLDTATVFHVEAGDFFGTGRLPRSKSGVCLVRGNWRMESSLDPISEVAESAR